MAGMCKRFTWATRITMCLRAMAMKKPGRMSNPVYRGQQEILTVAYTDISDDELRRINAVPMLDMIGINLNGEKRNETTQ